MSARSALHLIWLAAALVFAACSLDPQPEPPMSPSNLPGGGGGAAGAWSPDTDAGQSGGAAMQDAGAFDALSEAPPCTGCAEGKCEAGECACDESEGGCDAGACPCGDADADACSPDAPESDADAALDATTDASLD